MYNNFGTILEFPHTEKECEVYAKRNDLVFIQNIVIMNDTPGFETHSMFKLYHKYDGKLVVIPYKEVDENV